VALFVLMVVAVVVAQTWLDWRDEGKHSPIPDWAKGTAVASVAAILMASAASYASVWIEGSGQSTLGSSSQLFWPEVGILLCAMGVIIAAARKKRLRWIFVLTGIVVAAFWLGVTLSQ
jgi:cytochrome bd-type quinol oxidase subunit 2